MRSDNLRGLQVAIVQGSEVTLSEGYGFAEGRHWQMSAATPLVIGSLSKSVTALAILQLVEQGKLELDEPVVTYLPWFHTSEKAQSDRITLRMLLNHTSGLSNAIGLQPVYDRQSISLQQRVEKLSEYQLTRQPGERFEYSNANYLVLGAVIQSVSDSSYDEYIRENIFIPLNMDQSHTYYDDSFGVAPESYWLFGFPVSLGAGRNHWLGDSVPAGYLISTADDMGHYLVALLNGGSYQGRQILSPEGIQTLQTGSIATGSGETYGMGWIIGSKDGIPAVYHEGDAAGYTASIILDPENKIGVYVATNTSSMLVSPTSDLSTRLFASLHGQTARKSGPTTSQIYPIIDLFVLGLTAWMILAYIALPRWWKHLPEWRNAGSGTRFLRIFLPIVTDFLWPYILLSFLPQGAGFPMWKVFDVFQPDLAFWVQGLAWASIAKGLAKAILFVVFIRTHKPPSIARAFRRNTS